MPCILVNGDHIRDLGLPVYNVGIVVGIWYWKEYLRKTKTKKDTLSHSRREIFGIYLSKINLRSDRGHHDSSKISGTATAMKNDEIIKTWISKVKDSLVLKTEKKHIVHCVTNQASIT